MERKVTHRPMDQEVPPAAKRFETLLAACSRFYPHQQNTWQFRPNFKQRQEGQFPLDVIYAFSNPGNPASDIAPHWHYIGLSLSDLYSDKRVDVISGNDICSEYRFELTFRLKRKPDNYHAPDWPACVMQSAANHCLQSNKCFYPGDYLSFVPLYVEGRYSKIHHVLFSEDPQLGTVQTSFGPVTFLQMVGVCANELEVAKQGKGQSVTELMKFVKGAGGPWLITDMRRDKTVFELYSSVRGAVNPYGTSHHSLLPLSHESVDILKKNN